VPDPQFSRRALAGWPPGRAESLPAPAGQPELNPPSDPRVRSSFNGPVALMMNVCTLCRPRRRPRCCQGPRPSDVRAPDIHRGSGSPLNINRVVSGSLCMACVSTSS
jgi:hypothetical protein